MDGDKSYSFLKVVGIFLFSIFGLWLIYVLVFGLGYGMNIGYRGSIGNGQIYMNYSYGLTGIITFLLSFLIKVLFVIFAVSLIIGIVIEIKKYVFAAEDVREIKNTFTGGKTVILKEACGICGMEVEKEWNVCPQCGNELKTQSV